MPPEKIELSSENSPLNISFAKKEASGSLKLIGALEFKLRERRNDTEGTTKLTEKMEESKSVHPAKRSLARCATNMEKGTLASEFELTGEADLISDMRREARRGPTI